MKTLQQLKHLAARLGCEIEDDKDGTTLYVHALNGKAWDGSLSSLIHPYGSCGDYAPEWRRDAIQDAFDRLIEYGAPDSDFAEA